MHSHQKKPALTKFYSLFRFTALCALFHEAAAQSSSLPSLRELYTPRSGCGDVGCKLCMGDCDNDGDCWGGLRCFHRNALESVPGCSGDGVAGANYCTLPWLTTGVTGWVGCGAGGCDRCEGDCDSNSDCKAGLRCFHRKAFESVPGCSGDGVRSMDYCVPQGPPLKTSGCGAGGCGLCEGDCDTDGDCKAGLRCFHRAFESVPGCSGEGVAGADYCILRFLPFTPPFVPPFTPPFVPG